MSNFLSTPTQYKASVTDSNFELLSKVALAQQGAYNANHQKIQQTLDAFGAAKTLRPEDDAYIAAKLEGITAQINNIGGNLASNSRSESLIGNIKMIAQDPFVLNAFEQTSKMKNYQKELASLKEKNPKLYSDTNNAYALYQANYKDYMSGKSDKLGTLSYTPFTDITEEQLKKIKTIKDIKGKRVIETLSPDGTTKITRSIDGLTDVEIQSYMGSIMSPEELSQLKINGWAKWGQDETQAREAYADYNTKRLANNKTNTELYESKAVNKNLSEADREFAKNKLKELKETKENIQGSLDKGASVPVDTIGMELEKASYLTGLSSIASTEWSTTYEANDVYFKTKELELSYENLAIKKADSLREDLKFKAEQGLNPDGTPITEGVTSVSSRELTEEELGDMNGQKNLHDRHNEYYNQVLNTAKGFLSNQNAEGSDKKAFQEELKSRGLDNNMNWIDKEKSKTYSKANTIQAAFNAAKLGASYKAEWQAINDASYKKQNIAKDLNSVESASYLKTFNKEPDKYISNLKIAESELDPSFSIVSDVTGRKENISLKKEINTFVKKAGGWSNVKNYLVSNPKELKNFADLTDKADNAYKGVDPYIKTAVSLLNPINFAISLATNDRTLFNMGDKNLKEDSKKEIETTLQNRAKAGTMSSFTDYNDINFHNKGVNQHIIEKIPQGRIEGTNFDPKLPITARLVGKDIEIYQSHGSTMTGAGQGGTYVSKKFAKATLTPGDSSYNEILKYIDVEENKKMGLNADTTYVNLPPSRTNMASDSEEIKSENTAYNIATAVQGNKSIPPLFSAVGGDPTAYTNATKIRNTLSLKLSDYPKETVEVFTNEYLKRLPNFTITPTTSKIYGDKKWGVSIKNENGKEILNKSLNIKNLDEDTHWLLDNAPQTFITEHFLQTILADPTKTKINTILNGGN